jgi:uncharacterized phage protein (TIGR01671 family)
MMMKREILFKAKSIDTGEWFESMTISVGTINRKNNALLMKISENKWIEVDPYSLSQYINKKDKNGKKVFEGDYDEDGNFVVWCDECSSFEFSGVDLETKEVYPTCYRCDGDFSLFDSIDDFQIIGNIADLKK